MQKNWIWEIQVTWSTINPDPQYIGYTLALKWIVYTSCKHIILNEYWHKTKYITSTYIEEKYRYVTSYSMGSTHSCEHNALFSSCCYTMTLIMHHRNSKIAIVCQIHGRSFAKFLSCASFIFFITFFITCNWSSSMH